MGEAADRRLTSLPVHMQGAATAVDLAQVLRRSFQALTGDADEALVERADLLDQLASWG